jgi:hypothetical protein
LQPNGVQLSEKIFREQFFHNTIAAQTVGRRAQHGHLLGKAARSCQHFFRFGAIVRHSGLTKHMFARFKRGNGDGGMHIGGRSNPDDIDVWQSDEVGPVSDGDSGWNIFLAELFCAFISGI